MNKSLHIVLCAAVLAVLAGCGAKGPLILPEKAVPIEAPVETTPQSPPESVPHVDGSKSDAVPSEAPIEGTVETPPQPAQDD
ncbi:MAG: lipoprotein [Pseudoxanthomonas sp.]